MIQDYKLKYKFKKWNPNTYYYEEKSILPVYPSKRTIIIHNTTLSALPTWLIHHINTITKKRTINNKKRYIWTSISESTNIYIQNMGTISIEHNYTVKFSGFIKSITTILTATHRNYTESGILKDDELFIHLTPLRAVYNSSKPALKLITNLTTPLNNTGMYNEHTQNLIKELINYTWEIDKTATVLLSWKGQGIKITLSDTNGKLYSTRLKSPRKNNNKEIITKLTNKLLKEENNLT